MRKFRFEPPSPDDIGREFLFAMVVGTVLLIILLAGMSVLG